MAHKRPLHVVQKTSRSRVWDIPQDGKMTSFQKMTSNLEYLQAQEILIQNLKMIWLSCRSFPFVWGQYLIIQMRKATKTNKVVNVPGKPGGILARMVTGPCHSSPPPTSSRQYNTAPTPSLNSTLKSRGFPWLWISFGPYGPRTRKKCEKKHKPMTWWQSSR